MNLQKALRVEIFPVTDGSMMEKVLNDYFKRNSMDIENIIITEKYIYIFYYDRS